METYLNEIANLKNWMKELNPVKDAEKIEKIETVLDRMGSRFMEFITSEETR